jgi:hypothetical protein
MKLIYTETGNEVQVGDTAKTFRGELVSIDRVQQPHKPSSTGRVNVTFLNDGTTGEFFPGVIVAAWTDRGGC